jgi:hypothetical protein
MVFPRSKISALDDVYGQSAARHFLVVFARRTDRTRGRCQTRTDRKRWRSWDAFPIVRCHCTAAPRSALEQKRQGNGTVASARGARIPQIDWKTGPVSGDWPRLADHNSRPPRNENVTRKLEGGGLTTLLQVDYFLPALRETIAAIRGSRIARFRGQLPTFYLTIIRSAP